MACTKARRSASAFSCKTRTCCCIQSMPVFTCWLSPIMACASWSMPTALAAPAAAGAGAPPPAHTGGRLPVRAGSLPVASGSPLDPPIASAGRGGVTPARMARSMDWSEMRSGSLLPRGVAPSASAAVPDELAAAARRDRVAGRLELPSPTGSGRSGSLLTPSAVAWSAPPATRASKCNSLPGRMP